MHYQIILWVDWPKSEKGFKVRHLLFGCFLRQCLTFGIDKYFIVKVYQLKLSELLNTVTSPRFFGVYIISWSDLILNPVFSKILCVKIMIPKYSCRLQETLGHFSQIVIKQKMLSSPSESFIWKFGQTFCSTYFFLSSKYAITTLFRYADEGFIFLNRQFDIYLMLNQYFDSALPVVDTCLRLQRKNQANLFFLKIVKKKISSWSLTDDLRSREIHSFINM